MGNVVSWYINLIEVHEKCPFTNRPTPSRPKSSLREFSTPLETVSRSQSRKTVRGVSVGWITEKHRFDFWRCVRMLVFVVSILLTISSGVSSLVWSFISGLFARVIWWRRYQLLDRIRIPNAILCAVVKMLTDQVSLAGCLSPSSRVPSLLPSWCSCSARFWR